MSQVSKSPANHWWMLVVAVMLGIVMVGANAHTVLASGAPEVQHSGDLTWTGNGDDDDGPRFYGLVEQMPQGGRFGEWQIGGRTVVANAQTEFDETEGAIGLGACVKVEFVSQGSTTAREIDSEPLTDCNGGGDDDDEDGVELYGIVETMPAGGTVGAWMVSGNVYTVTAQTELKTEYGAFDIGRCVKIHLVTGSTDTVREMETERGYKCAGGGSSNPPPAGVIGRGELYGELKSFPQGLVGIWEIGALTFTATISTEFKTANGPFTVGEIVKVEFYVMPDSTFLAHEIKTAMADWSNDDDDDDDGGRQEGHAFGIIEQLPADGLIGVWTVGGVSYNVTEATELRTKGGTFAISETVKIEFRIDGSGTRTAKEVKLMFPQGTPGNEDATLVGFVDAMPQTGYVGQWVVNGVEFTANAQSKFKEDHGALTVGAYVKVEYRLDNGVRVIHEMESAVPPGAGDDNFVGNVEQMDDSAVVSAALIDSVWVIGGRTYVVTPSTRVDGALELADTAWVNSHVATDGTLVATSIQGLTLNNFVYLPITRR